MTNTTYDPPVSTYTALATYEVSGSSTNSITISSLPTSYKHLVLIINGGATISGVDPRLQFNGDTGSNYRFVWGAGTSGSNAASTSIALSVGGGRLDTTERRQVTKVFINDYRGSRNKGCVSLAVNAGEGVGFSCGYWSNTNAINSLTLTSSTNFFQDKTTFGLYGVN